MPILDNCSGVWRHTKHYIESEQLRAVLGVHWLTPILAKPTQGDSGWFPSFYRHQLNMLRLWNHLVTMNDDRVTKLVFMWDTMLNFYSNLAICQHVL